MEHLLKNEFLTATINDIGAELTSLFDVMKQRQVLWEGDPAFWSGHAPLLFPNVGRHYQYRYLYEGKEYPSILHGFARDSVFTVTECTESSVTHALSASEATKKNYPFDFTLEVTQSLKGNNLYVDWKVTNTGNTVMPFTIGGHPAFKVPILPDTKQTDYRLLFNRDQVSYCKANLEWGCAIPQPTYPLHLENKSCPITDHMFDEDALIFDHQIDWIAITYPDGTPYISMSCKGFTSFGIWSLPGAPYICLEPWDGRCDDVGFVGDIFTKPGILTLEPQAVYKKGYSVQIHA